jgi:hypothetical protein
VFPEKTWLAFAKRLYLSAQRRASFVTARQKDQLHVVEAQRVQNRFSDIDKGSRF